MALWPPFHPFPTYEVELHLELVVKQAAIQVAIHTGVNGTKIYTSYVDLVQYQPEKMEGWPLKSEETLNDDWRIRTKVNTTWFFMNINSLWTGIPALNQKGMKKVDCTSRVAG